MPAMLIVEGPTPTTSLPDGHHCIMMGQVPGGAACIGWQSSVLSGWRLRLSATIDLTEWGQDMVAANGCVNQMSRASCVLELDH